MDAPVSAAIAGGVFAIAGLGLLLLAWFGLPKGRGEPPEPRQPGADSDASGGAEPQPPPKA
jgi:hypothetical protein